MKVINWRWKRYKIWPVLLRIFFFFNFRRSIEPKNKTNIVTPFFVLGSGRNGSTLLSAILNEHPKILIPPEQFALPFVIMRYQLSLSKNWKGLVNRLARMLYKKNVNWDLDYHLLLNRLSSVEDDRRSLKSFIQTVYFEYGRQKKRDFEIWGDKTPLNTEFLQFIYYAYPEAKYIFLLRDGRDVVNSYSKFISYNRAMNIDTAIWKWKYSLSQYEWLKRRVNSGNLLLVKYEELVINPEKEFRNIIEFLGVSSESINFKSVGDPSIMGVDKKPRHRNLKQPVSSSAIGKWKYELSLDVLDLVYREIKSDLENYGYL